jgi:hypothetical protein
MKRPAFTGSCVRLHQLRLRTALVAIAVLACLLWWGIARLNQCPNCRTWASLAESVRHGGCPGCGLSYCLP